MRYKFWKSMQNRAARISNYKMINFDDISNKNKTEHKLFYFLIADMIADMISSKNPYPIVTELFIRGKKLLLFFTQSSFKVPKEVILNTTHFFIMKIPNKRELQQTAINHSSDVGFKDFMKICKKCTAELYSCLANDNILSSNNPLRFRKNLFE